ncbi:MAG: glycosyltransferase family 2 protein [Acidobacteriota bacterium]|nr:glycosyltransferase family 2 protein [Acidobacteriota bacterium]
MVRVSATVICRDEAHHIEAALESVRWADEIVVVDSGSSDGTVEIALRFTDKVVAHAWPGYAAQKDYAASIASHDWILSIDADERVSPALASEIKAVLERDPAEAAFRLPRMTRHFGRWLRTTDAYPDYQIRLYDRRRARWKRLDVHESIETSGAIGALRNDLLHEGDATTAERLEKLRHYARLSAAEMHRRGRRGGVLAMTLHPPAAFLRSYLLRRGFMDGSAGLRVSALQAYYVYMKFAFLRDNGHTR